MQAIRLVAITWETPSPRSARSVVMPSSARASSSGGNAQARVPLVASADLPSGRLVAAVDASERESIALEMQERIVAAHTAHQLL
jgi:hypothetical protein